MKSPLRYPGGKTRAISILEAYVPRGTRTLLSPFFGGGSFEIAQTQKGIHVKANDLFFPLYTFWTVAQTRPLELSEKVREYMPVTKDSFMRIRKNITSCTDPIDIAASFYVINRCSFNGSTFCGGFSSAASVGRLNESALQTLQRIQLPNVEFTNLDAVDFLARHPDTPGTIVYADPPYYISSYLYGRDGDLHEAFDHERFARAIQTRRDWIISYNDCPYIRGLYAGCTIHEESWSYGMNASKKSSEIVITP
jgi:DNA adenine methylase